MTMFCVTYMTKIAIVDGINEVLRTVNSSIIDFLLRMLRVLSRSWQRSQKKTLCLGWHEDLQIHLKIGLA
jgi:hypothetical protein